MVFGVAALFCLLQSLAFADEILDRARRLMQQKNPQAAYQLLEPLESKRAGEVDFDYLLGIAALDSGQRERAVFALERVLAVNPNHAQARAEIARAYFEMGEKVNARREFENVRAGNPPEAVKQTIDRYLSALEAGPRRFSGFAELGLGHDSNVNSATVTNQIAIPALGGIVATLAPSGVKQSDNFTTAGGGLNYVYGFTPEWAVIAGAAANGKFNRQHDDFDTATVDGNLGLRWSRDKEAVTAGYQGQDFRVDNNDFRKSNGVVAQWQHNYSEYHQVSLFVQRAELDYPTQTIRDARRTIGGVAFGYGWDTPGKPVIFGSLYGGREKEKAADVPQLGHKPVGGRLGGQVSISDKAVLFGLVNYEQRVYGGDEPFFLVTRRDKQADVRLGIDYTLSAGWLLVPQLSYTRNDSNIELDKYDRTVVSLVLRRTF
ncbi:MAG: surface lipoprotein assembly modifier [Burkholderiales bacterium]